MKDKTARGIYLSTLDSEDFFFVYKNLKFYFSSEFNLRRFKDKVCKFTYDENEKFINKYKINIDLIDFFLFSFYENIEKRGYKILDMENNTLIVNSKNINVSFRAILLEK